MGTLLHHQYWSHRGADGISWFMQLLCRYEPYEATTQVTVQSTRAQASCVPHVLIWCKVAFSAVAGGDGFLEKELLLLFRHRSPIPRVPYQVHLYPCNSLERAYE